jgi:aspartate carbamoyltransferase catalytic subunit
MRHIIDFSDISLDEWDKLYNRFLDIMSNPNRYNTVAQGKLMASLFFEPSTRTRFSFEAAMQRLGGGVLGFSDPAGTSASKGESIKDTAIMCSGYTDVLVMRHPQEGSAAAAALYSRVPVVNGGDGGHCHPTQTLTDLTTIQYLRGEIGYRHVGFCGDLHNGRTVHSLIRALVRFRGVSLFLIAPDGLGIPDYLRSMLAEQNIEFKETHCLDEALPHLDVLYMTRIQRERFADPAEYTQYKGVYILNKRRLMGAREDLLILHPLPRVDEIAADVDADLRAGYFEQARLGMFIRMALLTELLDQKAQPLAHLDLPQGRHRCRNPRCVTGSESYLPLREHNGHCGYCDHTLS